MSVPSKKPKRTLKKSLDATALTKLAEDISQAVQAEVRWGAKVDVRPHIQQLWQSILERLTSG